MIKKALILPVWLMATMFTLGLALTTYINQEQPILTPTQQVFHDLDTPPDLLYAAIPNSFNQIKTAIRPADARPEIVRQYLKKYKSPLEPYADLIVKVSDDNGFDFRWLVAIAQQESNLCKRIPEDSHNCWGWGIYGDKVTRFDDFEHAITAIAPQFKKIFLSKGPKSMPEEVMKTYTPPSDGSWAFGVNQFMTDME